MLTTSVIRADERARAAILADDTSNQFGERERKRLPAEIHSPNGSESSGEQTGRETFCQLCKSAAASLMNSRVIWKLSEACRWPAPTRAADHRTASTFLDPRLTLARLDPGDLISDSRKPLASERGGGGGESGGSEGAKRVDGAGR